MNIICLAIPFITHQYLTLIFILEVSSRSPLNIVTGDIFRVLSAPNNDVGLSTYTNFAHVFWENIFSRKSFSSIILLFAFPLSLPLTTILSIPMPCFTICSAMVMTWSSLVPSIESLIGHSAFVIRQRRFFFLSVTPNFFISISIPTIIASRTTNEVKVPRTYEWARKQIWIALLFDK